MYFAIYLKHIDGSGSFLSHKGRTRWKVKTARKHLRDCVCAKMNKAQFKNVDYFAMVAA